MALVAYLDESGDHSMKKVDPTSPNFCLTLAVFDTNVYTSTVVPAFTEFKFKYFGHEGVVLHSTDIRRQHNEFGILRNRDVREEFLDDLTALMRESDYCLISIVIDKAALSSRYVKPYDPYELSLGFALERLSDWAQLKGVDSCHIVAEARGKRENDSLAAEHLRIITQGNSVVPGRLFQGLKLPLTFIAKKHNLIGHQIADLSAYVVNRRFSHPGSEARAFEALRSHFFKGGPASYNSLKRFP